MAIDCEVDDDRLRLRPSRPEAVRQITTAPWPGFPSDMVSLICVLATQARGATLIHDWMYELRLFALEQLSGMSADLFLCDPHRMIVNGPAGLTGRVLDSRDLRSGMALIAAALAADGTSRIHPLETVERGYAQLVERLLALGARIQVEGRVTPRRPRGLACEAFVARARPTADLRHSPCDLSPGSAWRNPRGACLAPGSSPDPVRCRDRDASPRVTADRGAGGVWGGPGRGRSLGAARAAGRAAAAARRESAPAASCSG